jgi:hypothetical protein
VTPPTDDDRADPRGRTGGFGQFLRSLLAGVPWSERAETEEVLELDRPRAGLLRVHNANGRIRLVGDERDNVEVRAAKTARAESSEAAQRLLRDIRLLHETHAGALELEVDIPRRWNRRPRSSRRTAGSASSICGEPFGPGRATARSR